MKRDDSARLREQQGYLYRWFAMRRQKPDREPLPQRQPPLRLACAWLLSGERSALDDAAQRFPNTCSSTHLNLKSPPAWRAGLQLSSEATAKPLSTDISSMPRAPNWMGWPKELLGTLTQSKPPSPIPGARVQSKAASTASRRSSAKCKDAPGAICCEVGCWRRPDQPRNGDEGQDNQPAPSLRKSP